MTTSMLHAVTDNIWYAQHAFKVNGVPVTSRMTVVRLADGALWVHSPIPIDERMKDQLDALGQVRFVVAPSKVHHLYAGEFAARFPAATLYGAPGLARKRPDLTSLQPLPAEPGTWGPELEYHLFRGIPFANETVWYHAPSATLILTDLCQWWQGDLPWQSILWNRLTGVRKSFDVPRTVRALVRDKSAAAASANKILEWRVQRIIMAHNAIIEADAHAHLARAFRRFQ